VKVFAYGDTVAEMGPGQTQLEASLTASLLSGKESSNLIVTHIERCTESNVRGAAELLRNRLAAGDKFIWPHYEIRLPLQE
jgi:hypothetical protein